MYLYHGDCLAQLDLRNSELKEPPTSRVFKHARPWKLCPELLKRGAGKAYSVFHCVHKIHRAASDELGFLSATILETGKNKRIVPVPHKGFGLVDFTVRKTQGVTW